MVGCLVSLFFFCLLPVNSVVLDFICVCNLMLLMCLHELLVDVCGLVCGLCCCLVLMLLVLVTLLVCSLCCCLLRLGWFLCGFTEVGGLIRLGLFGLLFVRCGFGLLCLFCG